MKKIGIPSNNLLHPNSPFGTNYVDYIQKNYIDGITNANALPIVLPIGNPKLAKNYIDSVDALVLAGGQDVSPLYFGEDPQINLHETDSDRDAFEVALVLEAIKQEKPILGICRGLQIVNVALGGTLYQDLNSQYQGLNVRHNQYPTKWYTPTHRLILKRVSWLQNFLDDQSLVNSFHHQAVKKLGDGLQLDAVSTDNVVEAFSDESRRIYAVQWHPEMLLMKHPEAQKLFDTFVLK
ncbi:MULTISPECIES: gamma-glutamyl-gamma-aminobutyrate hydrolase family protein [Leuconostoc]|uniref:Gamma-glutamyl-gamma-aminobutyrate hydrolase family protein n=2 Tax=Leuconostoc pseudomesenteroides TaxID=33968 RepID=A0A5B8T5R2_LEUPS|nr:MULTISPECIES: gamma-glutamyl-gamma-aminobutyrate hydrolase family protein [Leuconostoc]MBK0040644.1 gamma-glutamyl-gamma-aminobutyrate hydrolase family protein [Leuconostoc sp. S51]MBK0051690.1 gamma-glutamyl-gamma-aminobutyrate hydrolase family protein [Leuconostoc sp. S50]MBS0958238.1 gamma-glutamyl-gamma-aminobutyrate hydrolase family protein [Leuconostoc pseudomesenteroides]MCT4380285.1 gamma-glutamyl-gamma-aminobutyrate hydrolase family protein [Leuconostoc pseudomesenteroides]MDN24511